ncbi:type VI secretion protein (plasmid) [Pseudochrobactrum algeriensis]|uniref:Type IV secretion system protein virB8 n=1 Tax=Pseudochrobactrum kiredjianiae TaxID=386305 RepID=A0ABW3V1D0_9HYPH|nr:MULTISPECIES: type IV secretion system protein [Pseudochrobactrum]MDM7852974.1 type IV secretion system protein [Pseudochrobactrum kiredjianiae]MDP8250925.1 type VI secretion protein [Pseudochrobactrum saccharolyticum]QVQ38640.1 type VI secretion protein [Pseudochrobactrum algeriensis]QVQ42204.1 type VI secretion protein [Pseudochrobactrum algeriensis]QVQ45784.1 type VI secretion protein [Pseudochrobactrum algeriensis]
MSKVQAKTDENLRSYYQSGEQWEQQIYKKAERSKRLAIFVAVIASVVAILAIITLMMLVPLKTFEPYIVVVDKNTGYTEVKSGLTVEDNITDKQAVTQANIVRYIRAREGYDPYAIEENVSLAGLLSTGSAANELQRIYSVSNAQNPARVYGKNKRLTANIKSVTMPNDNTALVRFSLIEKSDTDAIERHYISVVRYRYTDTPATNEWRFENPLGFQVYDYRREQETITNGDVK